MPIAGVVILTQPERANQVLERLQQVAGVTTYGVHQKNNIVAVLEADSLKGLEKLSGKIGEEIEGILGVYPAYVNVEDVTEAAESN